MYGFCFPLIQVGDRNQYHLRYCAELGVIKRHAHGGPNYWQRFLGHTTFKVTDHHQTVIATFLEANKPFREMQRRRCPNSRSSFQAELQRAVRERSETYELI